MGGTEGDFVPITGAFEGRRVGETEGAAVVGDTEGDAVGGGVGDFEGVSVGG